MKQQGRIIYIDVVKIIACFWVIVNHTADKIFPKLQPSPQWFSVLTYFFTSKPAVAMFLLASGAMLLKKEYSYKEILIKALRVAVVLVVFSLLYYFVFKKTTGMSIEAFWLALPAQHITTAFWYLYLYLALLIMIPVLGKLARCLDEKAFRYLIIVTLAIRCIMVVGHYIPAVKMHGDFQNTFFSAYVVTFLAGYYLHSGHDLKSKKSVTISILTSIFCTVLLVFATYYEFLQTPDNYLYFDNRNTPLILLQAGLIFLVIKYIVSHISFGERMCNIISALGNATFGIYLLSDLLLKKLDFVWIIFQGLLPQLPAMVIFQLIVFGIGFLITYLLRKIPVINRFL